VPSLTPVPVSPLPPERFREVLGDAYAAVEEAISESRELLAGRVVWHINSTAAGGGVAELLQMLLPYARGAGADVRWMVAGGDPAFFRITKGLHNRLHGVDGDAMEIGGDDRQLYRDVCAANANALAELVRPGDVVYLHDPQTAGMTRRIKETGAFVIWRCHVGANRPDAAVRSAWEFLRPEIEPADRWVFSRPSYVWDGLDPDRVSIIMPSIDAFSPKNEELSPQVVEAILDRIGVSPNGGSPAVFSRHDGTTGRVDRGATLVQDEPVPQGVPTLTQVSRWDRLKDPVGVLRGFADYVELPDARLLLVGPDAEGVSDDPEGAEVYRDVVATRESLADDVRRRVHLISLPMDDVDENAAMVNAIQRFSHVIAQKSLAEGFGLTATEAMWKGKPVIAGAVGGLQDQIVDGVTGVLIDDPADLAAFGAAANRLLADPELAAKLGAAGQERVREKFLGTRHLLEYVALLGRLLREAPREG
jgi:trehalose synthase